MHPRPSRDHALGTAAAAVAARHWAPGQRPGCAAAAFDPAAERHARSIRPLPAADEPLAPGESVDGRNTRSQVIGVASQPCCGNWRIGWNPAASPTQPSGYSMPLSSHATGAVRGSRCMFLACQPAARAVEILAQRASSSNTPVVLYQLSPCLDPQDSASQPSRRWDARQTRAPAVAAGHPLLASLGRTQQDFHWQLELLAADLQEQFERQQPFPSPRRSGAAAATQADCCWAARGAKTFREWSLP